MRDHFKFYGPKFIENQIIRESIYKLFQISSIFLNYPNIYKAIFILAIFFFQRVSEKIKLRDD